jgi:hypothetical protein
VILGAARGWLAGHELKPVGIAALLSATAVAAATGLNARSVLLALTVLAVSFGAVLLFISAPHVAVAALVPILVFLPMGRALVTPELGPLKDALIGAAALALIARVILNRGFTGDRLVLVLVLPLFGLYLLNAGGLIAGHGPDAAWGHGVRLVMEPLILLLYGMTVSLPRRTFAWLTGSVVVCTLIVAIYGLVQQWLGPSRLVELGYLWNVHIRTIEGRFRSFGTLDDPFLYAAVLLFGIVVLFFGRRWTIATWMCLFVLVAGISVSYVRTAALVAVALLGLLLIRRGFPALAALLLAVASLSAAVLVATTNGSESTFISNSGEVFTVNNRTKAWRLAIGSPESVPFGQGVGAIGTAAERAADPSAPTVVSVQETVVVDSSYFATLADVGVIGLILLLALYARLGLIAARSTRQSPREAWVALGALAVLVLDGVTRASTTGFPTAALGMLIIGVSLAAAREGQTGLLPRQPQLRAH